METTTMMIIEFTFVGWWGWLMLAPLYKEPKPKTMRDVRKSLGIDVDACDAAWEQYCKENRNDNA